MTDVNQTGRWSLAPLALLAGAVPIVAVHAAWLVSLRHGHVEPCIPYVSGCASISLAARHGGANFLFKAIMLPYAALLAAYWLAVARWLDLLEARSRSAAWIVPLALVSAAFLVLYATFLGSEGHFYQLMRRYGVTVYFAFNLLAQLLFTGRLLALAGAGSPAVPRWLARAKLALCAAVLALGLANVGGAVLLADNDAFENVIEWHAALLMTVFYFFTWAAWRRDGFGVAFARGA